MTDKENDTLWKNYFYPNSEVLINNLNIHDSEKLKEAETAILFLEALVPIKQNDFKH